MFDSTALPRATATETFAVMVSSQLTICRVIVREYCVIGRFHGTPCGGAAAGSSLVTTILELHAVSAKTGNSVRVQRSG